MENNTVIHARIDRTTKKATEKVLDKLGMTPTEVIRLLYRQIALRQEFPLELHVPNKLTAAALKKSEKGQNLESFRTLDELYASWEE